MDDTTECVDEAGGYAGNAELWIETVRACLDPANTGVPVVEHDGECMNPYGHCPACRQLCPYADMVAAEDEDFEPLHEQLLAKVLGLDVLEDTPYEPGDPQEWPEQDSRESAPV